MEAIKKKIICCLIIIVGLLVPNHNIIANAATETSNQASASALIGSGTDINPYLICNANDLKLMRNNLSAHYKLFCDIDLGGEEWIPIGSKNAPFTGTLDGNGYTISDFKITSSGTNAGFFGVTNNVNIKNLNLDEFIISGTNYVGALVGTAQGTISNIKECNILKGTVSGKGYVGGIIGGSVDKNNLTVTECSSNADVNGTSTYVGGLIGEYYCGNMDECYFTGTVTSTSSNVGGLVGASRNNNYNRCYSTGIIKGLNYVGGLIGSKNQTTTMENCFALGDITGKGYVAGLIGHSFINNTIKNCYSASKISGSSNISGLYTGSITIINSYYDAEKTNLMNTISEKFDKLTAAMVSQENYQDWDFDEVWDIDEGNSYPYLRSLSRPDEVDVSNISITGNGTTYNPYIIRNSKQLKLLHYDLGAYYKLGANIDLSGEEWSPVGTTKAPFTGTLDGCGYSISNFKITSTNSYVGLFAVISNANIKNLNLNSFKVKGTDYVGALVGTAQGTISNIKRCNILKGTVSGKGYVGGIIGKSVDKNNLTVTECSSNADVNGTSTYVGGLIGEYYCGNMDKCYFTGTVTSTSSNVGGLVGVSRNNNYNRCYSTGIIKGLNYVGGLIGSKNQTTTMENCFALGDITGKGYVAGLIGHSYINNTIKNCYSASKIIGSSNISGLYTGSITIINSYYDAEKTNLMNTISEKFDKLTAAMVSQENYQDWDFDEVWDIDEGESYPYLRSIKKPDDIKVKSLSIQGKGTQNDPYIIKNAKELKLLHYDLGSYYKLDDNIDLSGEEWLPVGTTKAPFTGVVDGCGYTISNFKIASSSSNAGFFGVTNNVNIKNLNLDEFTVKGTDYVGALVGTTQGTISNIKKCNILSGTVFGKGYVGGIIGKSVDKNNLTVTECSSNADVNGTSSYVGGLIGEYYCGNMDECYFTGTVTSTSSNVGGLVGVSRNNNYNRCYSTGIIKGLNYVGGLIGSKNQRTTMENCFALGDITGKGYVAGLIGHNYINNTIKNCYSASKISGSSNISGLYTGPASIINSYYDAEVSSINNTTSLNIDRLTGAMVSRSNYKEWDFDEVWAMDEGVSYPHLRSLPIPSAALSNSALISGNGTEENPYIIKTKEQLNLIKYHLSAWYIIANDIDLEGEEWIPIGTKVAPFTGHLDGGNFTVSNFVINSKKDYKGFFAATNNAAISNLKLTKLSITGYNYVGSLIANGIGNKTKLTNCHITEAVITGHSYIGGIAGSYSGSMSNCTFSGTINASGNYTGGAAGYAPTGGDYTGCTIVADIKGTNYIGGVVGHSRGTINISGGNIRTTIEGKSHIGNYCSDDSKCVVENTTYSWVSGSGTEKDPYVISGAEGLNFASKDPTAHYKLSADVDCGGKVIEPIGSKDTPFTGGFDGNGHTISNAVIRGSGESSAGSGSGLFGNTNGGTIKNVNINNVTVDGTGSDYTGGLVGFDESEEAIVFENCHITNTTINAKSFVGSLIGGSNGLVIVKECSSDAAINSQGNYVGGLAGNCKLEMYQSYFTGVINATGNYVGGLVGYTPKASFEESFSSADLTGASYVGGLIGGKGSDTVTLLNCYAVGKLTGTSYTAGIIGISSGTSTAMNNVYSGTQIECTSHSGGLSGDNNNISLTSCYYDKVVNSTSVVTDYGRNTDVMIYRPNFIDWNFGEVWSIIEGKTYPYLRSMEMPAKVNPKVNTASGRVVNALTSNPIEGLKINVRKGTNAKTGDIIAAYQSGQDGTFKINNLTSDDYTFEIIGDGYVTTYYNFTIKDGENNIGDIPVMPLVTGNKMTIVLSWGENPSDLDSHLSGAGQEVYYNNKNGTGIVLDVDDTISYGPETITIDFDTLPEGTYNYFVKWYSGSGTWATSGAKVQVYLDNKLVNEFTAPSDLQTDNDWQVFTLDSKTKTITAK